MTTKSGGRKYKHNIHKMYRKVLKILASDWNHKKNKKKKTKYVSQR